MSHEIPTELAARIPDAAGLTLMPERLRERERIKSAGPDNAYVNRKFGRYREFVRDAAGNRVKDARTGEYKTRMMVPLHEPDGKMSRAGMAVRDTFGPQMEAEVEARNNREQYWHGRIRHQGARVERGEGGMLWRWIGGCWMPLGTACLGTPIEGDGRVARDSIQYSPDGVAHWWRGEWVKVDDDHDDD